MPAGHRLRYGPAAEGIERLEASLVGVAFSPHRHDTYAIGVTLAGVQTFRYRGESRHCLPGEWHVLHPDEVHDGAAGTGDGFGYRIFYIDPALVQEALGGAPLPFVADPVIRGRGVPASLAARLAGLDEPLDGFARVEVGVLVAGMLARYGSAQHGSAQHGSAQHGSARYGSARYGRRGPLPMAALARVRELIASDPVVRRPVEEFERVAGLDRWTIARQFRAAYGTSPTRFRTMRQLDLVRRLLLAGTPAREAAVAAGFADQAHMTRMFKRAYGRTPAAWRAALP